MKTYVLHFMNTVLIGPDWNDTRVEVVLDCAGEFESEKQAQLWAESRFPLLVDDRPDNGESITADSISVVVRTMDDYLKELRRCGCVLAEGKHPYKETL